MNKKSHLRSFLVLFSLTMLPLGSLMAGEKNSYWAIKNTDLSKLSKKHAAKYHKEMTKLLVKWSDSEKLPKYNDGRYMSLNNILNGISDVLIPKCYAAGEKCMFGGWPSIRKGTCVRPFTSEGHVAADEIGTTKYDSNFWCGSKRLFRCNPLVFGPGISQELAGSGYPNINGHREGNKEAPYHKGICVDVANGFNGVSRKCQEASDHLDKVRKENGQPEWRQSNFFDADKAKNFQALQRLIGEKCQNNENRRNSDGMCDSLEKSISLTGSAALAGQLNGVGIEEIMPECAGLKDTANSGAKEDPNCAKNKNEDLAGVYEALDKIKDMPNCKFGRVNAADATTAGIEIYEIKKCDVSVGGQLNERGLKNGEDIIVFLTDRDGKRVGQLTTKITMGADDRAPSGDVLFSKLTEDEANKAVLAEACQVAGERSCNEPKAGSYGAKLKEQLDQLKGTTYERSKWLGLSHDDVSCQFNAVEVDLAGKDDFIREAGRNVASAKESYTETGRNQSLASSHCKTHFDPDLQAALNSPSFKNKPVQMVIKIVKGGDVLNIPMSVDSAAISGVGAKIKGDANFQKFCQQEEQGLTGEEIKTAEADAAEAVTNMEKKFGISDKQHLTEEQRAALVALKDIEGLEVEIDEYGKMTFKHPNMSLIRGPLNDALPGIYVNGGDNTAVIFPNPETRVAHMAARSGTELSKAELAQLVALEATAQDNSMRVLSGLTRDADGNLVIVQNLSKSGNEMSKPFTTEEISRLERNLGGLVIVPDQKPEDKSLIRSYTLRSPASIETGSPQAYDVGRDLSAANDAAIANILRTGSIKREVERGTGKFNVVAAAPTTGDNGQVVTQYTLDVEGSAASQPAFRNRYLGEMKRAAERKGCKLLNPEGSEGFAKIESEFSIVCPAAE